MAFKGEFTPPGDKSVSHRLVLMSIIGEGEMHVTGLSDCEDVKSSLAIFRTLGGEASGSGARWTLKGLGGKFLTNPSEPVELDCGNSGTTMRLLSGILAGIPGIYVLDGDSQLRRRPMERVADPLRRMGGQVETTGGKPPVTITGSALHGIQYNNNDGSAQLKSAVIFAALSAEGPTRIFEPVPTRDHTERMLSAFGAKVCLCGQQEVEINPGYPTLPESFNTPADPSAAAFFLTGAAIIPGSLVTANNILLSGGRIGYLKVLDRMGASIAINMEQEKPEPSGTVTIEYKGRLTATEVEAEEVPSLIDEVPILALAAARAEGVSVFRQVRELRLKETDRLTAIKHQLGALGVRVWVENDDLFIEGTDSFIMPETLDSSHDHRMAMAIYIALALAGKSVPVIGDESIAISYPGFKEDLARLTSA
ncbi:3-phosphoshikimate 1-carboxyvinyltransferase [Deltaproteobacteria bacterium Smac51]|nr:3-phosphoshikimate 1-carboxyvinyltransferase [Deltaproteobacteria bacterium Smac51]